MMILFLKNHPPFYDMYINKFLFFGFVMSFKKVPYDKLYLKLYLKYNNIFLIYIYD